MSAILPRKLMSDIESEALYRYARRVADTTFEDFPWVDHALLLNAAESAVRRVVVGYEREEIRAVRGCCRTAVRNAITDVIRVAESENDRLVPITEGVVADDGNNPAASLDREEFWEVACRDLTERQAESVRLCSRDGLTHDDAASAMGVTRPAVTQFLAAAEPIVRRNLEAYLAC